MCWVRAQAATKPNTPREPCGPVWITVAYGNVPALGHRKDEARRHRGDEDLRSLGEKVAGVLEAAEHHPDAAQADEGLRQQGLFEAD